jgi:hypothetical protein
MLPKYVKPIAFTLNDLPCEDKLGNVTIQTSVPNITTKVKQTNIVKKTLTMSMVGLLVLPLIAALHWDTECIYQPLLSL